MKRILIFLFLLFASFHEANAFADPIYTLARMVHESPYISVGYVTKVFKHPNKEWEGTMVARIAIQERLKGEMVDDTIEIDFTYGFSCPPSDKYYPKTFVLLFLDTEAGRYVSGFNSYGAKTLDKVGVAQYKLRIREMQEIEKMENTADREAKFIEWVFACAAHEATRREAGFELQINSDLVLTPERTAILRKILLNSQSVATYEDFQLIELVFGTEEHLMDRQLINGLKALKPSRYPGATMYFEQLKHRNNSKEMETLLNAFDDITWEKKDEFRDVNFKQKDTLKAKKFIEQFLRLVE